MKKALVVMMILVVAIGGSIMFLKKNQATKKEERIEKYSSEIQPLLKNVKAVMMGDILIDDDKNPLAIYSYDETAYRNVHLIDASIELQNIVCENNIWYIRVKYNMQYKDDKGKVIMYADGEPTWKIKKVEGTWTVQERCGHGDFTIDEKWEKFWNRYGG